MHHARLAQLVREASRTTAQHVAGYERQRRHATLVAVTLEQIASLTDQAIDLFDRLVGTMFRKAEGRHARAFQADGCAINEKVRLYARVGTALIAARDKKEDAFDTITGVTSWGDHDTIEDCTDAVLWLAGHLADFITQRSLPAAFPSALAGDEYLRQLWTTGTHAVADKSRSGADTALANALGRLLLSRNEFAVVLAAFRLALGRQG